MIILRKDQDREIAERAGMDRLHAGLSKILILALQRGEQRSTALIFR